MTTTKRLAYISALAAVCLPVAAVQAADIDHAAPPYDPYASRYGSPYDDPRYRDMYEHPAPPPRYAAPYRPRSYRDNYLAPMDSAPRFDDPQRRQYSSQSDYCIPRGEAKRRLVADGWSDFHERELRGEVVLVRARRPSGRLFELRVDRCTGEILRADPLGRPYAEEVRPYGRGYY